MGRARGHPSAPSQAGGRQIRIGVRVTGPFPFAYGVGDQAADAFSGLDDAALRDDAEKAVTVISHTMAYRNRTMWPRLNGGTEDGSGPAARC